MDVVKPKTYCEKWPVGCQFCDLLLCDGKKETSLKRQKCDPCKPTQPECGECEFAKPITNADRIRAMTDEELAETMLDCFAAFYDVEWSKKDILDWLKQEADNGEN